MSGGARGGGGERVSGVRGWAVAATVGSTAAWGLAATLSKAALEDVPPFTLFAVQLSASVAVLWAAVLASGARVRLNRAAARAAASGLLEPGAAFALGVPGLALTSVTHAAVIGALEPAFIVAIAWGLFAQRPGGRVLGAIVLGTAGVALATAVADDGAAGGRTGDLLILGATLLAAWYVVTSSRLVVTVAPLVLVTLQQTVALGLALALAAVALAAGWERWPASGLLLGALAGVVQFAVAFWLYITGLKGLPVGQAGALLACAPLFGIGGAMVALGERPGAAQWAGAGLVVAAMAALSLGGAREPGDALRAEREKLV